MTTNRDEVRSFLTTRRAKVSPEAVALPGGSGRRVPGLRRSEVAALAGMSADYYTRVERGDLAGVSMSVLESIAAALRLDESEREHLLDLSRTANESPLRRARTRTTAVRPALRHVLHTITGGSALIRNGRLDVLDMNELARALYADVLAETPELNLARFAFLQRHLSDRFYPDWGLAADQAVAVLRTEAGRDPYDRGLQDLVGELSTRSDEFRVRWGAPRRAAPHGRPQGLPPPGGRRPRPGLRGRAAHERPRLQPVVVRRRARDAQRGRPRAARLVVGHAAGNRPLARGASRSEGAARCAE